MARYIKVTDGVLYTREVASYETQLIAELVAYGWVADDGMATMNEPVRASAETPPMVEREPFAVEAVDPALAGAKVVFADEWPVGLPPEWFGPLKDKFSTPDKVRAASNDELLALPGATHVTVAAIRRAFFVAPAEG